MNANEEIQLDDLRIHNLKGVMEVLTESMTEHWRSGSSTQVRISVFQRDLVRVTVRAGSSARRSRDARRECVSMLSDCWMDKGFQVEVYPEYEMEQVIVIRIDGSDDDKADSTYELHVTPLVVRVQVTGAEVYTTVDHCRQDPKVIVTSDATWAADVIDRVLTNRHYGEQVLDYDSCLVTKMVRWNDGTIHPVSGVYMLDELMRCAKREYGEPYCGYRTCKTTSN